MSFRDFAKDKYPLPHSFKAKPFNILTDLKPGMRVVHKEGSLTLPGVFVRYGTVVGAKAILIQTNKYGYFAWFLPDYIFLASSSEPNTSAEP